jgi:hypothetical protein
MSYFFANSLEIFTNCPDVSLPLSFFATVSIPFIAFSVFDFNKFD